MKIKQFQIRTLTIAINQAQSASPLNIGEFDGGHIIFPNGWTAANLAFKMCDTQAGTYGPVKDKAGSLIELVGPPTAAVEVRQIPPELFNGANWLHIWSETAGADVTQAAARTITLALYSKPMP